MAVPAILRRRPGWPLDRFSTVERGWSGGCCVIIGGGPSLTVEDCAAVEGSRASSLTRVIAVNNSYLRCPNADLLYFADTSWWEQHRAKPEFLEFAGLKCSIQNSGMNVSDPDVHILRNRNYPSHSTELSTDPEYLVTGWNSGFQALNLAVLAGVKTIILLGMDGAPSKAGKTHWHSGHSTVTPASAFPLYRQAMKEGAKAIAAAGVRVVNASPGSAIDAFPRMPLAQALELVA